MLMLFLAITLSVGGNWNLNEKAAAAQPDRRLGHCKAVYDSAAGRIESAWEYDAAGKVRYRFVVPQGTTAVLRLPGRSEEELTAGVHER